MKAIVNQKTCIGCTLCTGLAEEVFEMDGEKAKPIKGADFAEGNNLKKAKEAEENCPVGAIKIEK